MSSQPKLRQALLLIAITTFIFAGCQSSQGPGSPMHIRASISPAPVVGQTVTLHIEINPTSRNLPNTLMTVTLPGGVQAASADLSWAGDITANQPVNIDVPIQVTAAGDWPISIYAFSHSSPDPSSGGFGDIKILYVHSSASSAEVVEDIAATPIVVPVGGGEGGIAPPGSLVPVTPTVSNNNSNP